MSTWPSILCSPPKDLQTLRYNRAIWDFEASLHQREAETAAANEKAKVTHSRRDLRARVKCAMAVMKAKYEYHMAVQKARVERCTKLEESEATYSEALNGNTAALSLQCAMLRQEHTVAHVGIGSMCFDGGEQKLSRFPNSAPGSLTPGPTNTQGMTFILPTPFYWDHIHHPINPLCLPQHLKLEGNHSPLFPLSWNPKSPFPQRGDIHLWRHKLTRQWTRISPSPCRRNHRTLRKGGQLTGSPAWSLTVWMFLARTQILLKRQEPATSQLTPGIHPMVTQRICLIYSKNLHPRSWPIGWVYFQNTMVMEGARAFTAGQLCFPVSTQGAQIPKGGVHQGISQGNGPKGDSWPMRPSGISPGYTHCPWCGKSGQNEGTIINHLRTTHYKLGLICDQCFGCPTMMSDTLHRHGLHRLLRLGHYLQAEYPIWLPMETT